MIRPVRLTTAVVALLFPLAIGAAASPDSAPKAVRPNILWITSEDNGPFLGCYGYPDATTPNLDKLASEGILYRNAFANAPVCAPARCTIITGVYPPSMGTQHMRSRNRIPDMIRLFPRYLREAGYYCTNRSKTDYNLTPVDRQAWHTITRGDHTKRKPGQPFFAVYNIGTSHESSLHRPVDSSLTTADVVVPPYHPDTPEIRANWAQYHRVVTRMDGQVGAMLDRLQREGVADDTIVFYFADHGGILPRSKRFLYDTGVHVPMIIRFGTNVAHLSPHTPGATTDRLVSFIDLAPTVLSLAGIPIPDYMQGHAFLGAQAAEPQPYVYVFRGRMDERYDMSRAVRDKQFKYIRNYMPHRIYAQHLQYLWRMPATRSWEKAYREGRCTGPQRFFWEPKPVEELYDITADPWEVKNLAGDPAHAAVLARLRSANRAHLLKIRDSGFLLEAEMVDRSKEKTTYELVRDDRAYPLKRIMAASELAGEGKPENLPRLIELSRDEDSAVRYWAATGCAILRERAAPAAEALVKLLADQAPAVRVAAAEALAKQGRADRALSVLTKTLGQGGNAALHAANVLEELGEAARDAVEEIERAARKQGGYVKRATSHLLERLR